MDRAAIRKHLELERMFGAEFFPVTSSENTDQKSPHPGFRSGISKLETGNRKPETDSGAWELFRSQVLACTQCKLCSTRTQVVFGVGPVTAPLFFIGEGPGEQEDLQGEPFVGRAGQLLTKTLNKFGVSRSQVFISNIVKCRPPQNRVPQPDEVSACMPHLQQQIRTINPKVICTLGGPSTHALLNTLTGITKLRGRYHDADGRKIFPTFHPAYVLRNMSELRTLEGDIEKVCRDAGLIPVSSSQ